MDTLYVIKLKLKNPDVLSLRYIFLKYEKKIKIKKKIHTSNFKMFDKNKIEQIYFFVTHKFSVEAF